MARAFTIRKGLANPLRAEAARIYWEAFGGKLGTVMGPEPKAEAYLRMVMRGDHCISAIDEDGQLIGIAGFKSPAGSFAGGSPADLRRIYGRFGAIWRALVLRLLAHDVDNERFLVDGIAVTQNARGQGVGQALLEALYGEGYARGYPSIRLEVIEGNWRAQALYRREGFVVVAIEKLGLLRHVFGFDAAITMVRPLPPQVAAPTATASPDSAARLLQGEDPLAL